MDASRVIDEVKHHFYNQKWADCGKDDPEWVSTNNGVFLCLTCCARHRSLGNEVSKIKSIMHVDWEDDELLALQKGGNKSFKEFMDAYYLNDAVPQKKYNSVACHFYRKMLKGYITGIHVNDLPPTKNAGWQIVRSNSNDENHFDSNVNLSPIKKENSSIDLSRSSINYGERDYQQRWNNSVLLNKSQNCSRYSINI